MSPTFAKSTRVAVSAEELFAWHERPLAFQRLAPPWERIELLAHSRGLANGGGAEFRLWKGPLPIRWKARFEDCVEGRQFRDIQEKGPFAKWEHLHACLPDGDGASVLRDTVQYRLPLARLGSERVAGGQVERVVKQMFAYRHALTRADLEAHKRS